MSRRARFIPVIDGEILYLNLPVFYQHIIIHPFGNLLILQSYHYFMKYLFLLLPALLIYSIPSDAQQIPAYTAGKLMQRLNNKDTTYIVNFWATWCGPCVKELPQFDKLHQMYQGKPVKVIMASFDFKD